MQDISEWHGDEDAESHYLQTDVIMKVPGLLTDLLSLQ